MTNQPGYYGVAVCVGDGGALAFGGVLINSPAATCERTGGFIDQVTVGPSGSQTTLNGNDGSATFNSSATFNGGTQFNGNVGFSGNVGFTGGVRANQLNTGIIVNSGSLSTSSLNTGSFNASGSGTFGGLLSTSGFYANSGTIAALRVPGAATFSTSVAVGGRLTASQGLLVGTNATIDAGGNRIQNVGAPVAGTDAANKDYVNGAVVGVQGGIATLTTNVADHENRITAVEAANVVQDKRLGAVEAANVVQDTRLGAVEAANVVQDTRLGAVEAANAVQDTRLGAVETINAVQDTRLSAIETKDVGQDARMTAIEAVNATQSRQIGALQDQVGGLQTSVDGLRRDIRAANAGIAAAVALGGTMIVPDSNLSVSFNLATYRGQQGFAGSVVGRVGRRVYVNAGVGGSTMPDSTAGRVGVSFGL